MKGYKALVGAGLLGLSSLAGYGGESIKSENETGLELLYDGTHVCGKLKDIDISYHIRNRLIEREVSLALSKDGVEIVIRDGGISNTTIDGNLNFFELKTSKLYKYFFLKDNGDQAYTRGIRGNLTEEDKKLKEWGNKKLKEVHKICKEKFGDKLKIPYKVEKSEEPERTLDDILKDFDF